MTIPTEPLSLSEAAQRLGSFASHDNNCAALSMVSSPACTCGYTAAWQAVEALSRRAGGDEGDARETLEMIADAETCDCDVGRYGGRSNVQQMCWASGTKELAADALARLRLPAEGGGEAGARWKHGDRVVNIDGSPGTVVRVELAVALDNADGTIPHPMVAEIETSEEVHFIRAAAPSPPLTLEADPTEVAAIEKLRVALEPLAANGAFYKSTIPHFEPVQVPLDYLMAALRTYREVFGREPSVMGTDPPEGIAPPVGLGNQGLSSVGIAPAELPSRGLDQADREPQGVPLAIAKAIVDLVEGFDGYGPLPSPIGGVRLKDQPQWVKFYNAVASLRRAK